MFPWRRLWYRDLNIRRLLGITRIQHLRGNRRKQDRGKEKKSHFNWTQLLPWVTLLWDDPSELAWTGEEGLSLRILTIANLGFSLPHGKGHGFRWVGFLQTKAVPRREWQPEALAATGELCPSILKGALCSILQSPLHRAMYLRYQICLRIS